MEPEERLVQLLEEDTPETLAELRRLLEENPGLKEDKELYQQIVLAIRKRGEANLRSELDDYLREYLDTGEITKQISIRKYLFLGGMAASVALVSLFYYLEPAPTPNQLPPDWEINSKPPHPDSIGQETDSLKTALDSLDQSKQ